MAFSQDEEDLSLLARPIVAEGKRLYRSEMASWYGTDLFLEKYSDRSNIGGYFSYSEGAVSTCIFFNRAEAPRVIGTISFDSSYNLKTATVNLEERGFNAYEADLYQIRRAAQQAIPGDTLFHHYENANLNLIPLIDGERRVVYLLTGPKKSGYVIFGNDYLLQFDSNNRLTSKKGLHRNIITSPYAKQGAQVAGMHSHRPETGDFITATDICTLMLYARFAGWEQYNVVSEKYVNIWNCRSNELVVITMEAMKRIYDHQEAGKGGQ